jgi:phosphoribosylformimino-5-aminoimidazole carboxamide ribotide isomerase
LQFGWRGAGHFYPQDHSTTGTHAVHWRFAGNNVQIIPVLDLMRSQVVRGVAGRRDQYRPLESRLVEGSEPTSVASAIRDRFGLSLLYVADLDAILHRRPNIEILAALCAGRFSVMIDAGIRRCAEAVPILELGVDRVVAGLETLESPHELAELIRHHGAARIVFSVDLRDGRPMGNTNWPAGDPLRVAQSAVEAGCTQIIVLDIAGVGTGRGIPTLGLCAAIRRECPKLTIVTGGGVRGLEDLRRLELAQIDGVLIASALHDGSITSSDLAGLTSCSQRSARTQPRAT